MQLVLPRQGTRWAATWVRLSQGMPSIIGRGRMLDGETKVLLKEPLRVVGGSPPVEALRQIN